MNDSYLNDNWDRLETTKDFARPNSWPSRDPLVQILAFTLMPNHMHLLLREIRDGGVSSFMQKVGQSMTNHYNEKYTEHGSIFQGAYRSRTIETDRYLQYVSAYIMVKNVFELYPHGGLRAATKNFESAWRWGSAYLFSSLSHYAGVRTPIVDRNVLEEAFPTVRSYKSFARDVIAGGKWTQIEFE
ncbi:transposase [Candidatus Kaiserbacteria bacterium]|nr:transposase [Candidatus Kaiserbacteria bacterium]